MIELDVVDNEWGWYIPGMYRQLVVDQDGDIIGHIIQERLFYDTGETVNFAVGSYETPKMAKKYIPEVVQVKDSFWRRLKNKFTR